VLGVGGAGGGHLGRLGGSRHCRRRGAAQRRRVGDDRVGAGHRGLGLAAAAAPARRLGLAGGDVTAQAVTIRLAADAVSLGVLDARGVALDADPERVAEIERLFVGEPELSS
jgi:hypothetical protein